MSRPENSILHMYLSSGDFILKAQLSRVKYNVFSTECDANRPILKRKTFQGLKSQGNKAPSSSLMPFTSMANDLSCADGVLFCALLCKRANVHAGVSLQSRARLGRWASCSRTPPFLPSPLHKVMGGQCSTGSSSLLMEFPELQLNHCYCWSAQMC